VNNIEEYYDDVEQAAKSFRKGYKAVVALKAAWSTDYLQYKVSDITKEEVEKWIKNSNLSNKYTSYRILLPTPELSIL